MGITLSQSGRLLDLARNLPSGSEIKGHPRIGAALAGRTESELSSVRKTMEKIARSGDGSEAHRVIAAYNSRGTAAMVSAVLGGRRV